MANHSSEHVCRVPLWGQSDHSLQFFHSAKILWNVCCPLGILLLQLAEAGLGEGGRVTPFLCCHPALSILGIFRVFHDNFLGYLEPRIFTSGCNLKKVNHHYQASAAAPWVRSSIFRAFLFFFKKLCYMRPLFKRKRTKGSRSCF